MGAQGLDPETVREVFIYLYRCWLQKYLSEVPERLALSATDGVLFSPNLTMYYKTKPITKEEASDLSSRAKGSLFLVSTEFPEDYIGVTDLNEQVRGCPPFDTIFSIVRENLGWLDKHRERGLSRKEAYQTEQHGRFTVWKAQKVTRLLLQPWKGELYGYTIIQNAPNDFFFRRSKSCKQEGSLAGGGAYKRCQHRVENRASVNFDLLYETGEVLLLHLTLAGAGYKVFPRQCPEPQPETF